MEVPTTTHGPLLRRRVSAAFALIMCAIAAIVVALLWMRSKQVSVEWQAADSARIATLFADSSAVAPDDQNGFGFTYRPRWQDVQALFRDAPDKWKSYQISEHAITASFETIEAASAQLTALREADVATPGVPLFRGRLTDAAGQPVANATVDLMGPFVFINHFRTRDDGTFIMPMTGASGTPPNQWGYYLRIRASNDSAEKPHRWNTSRFRIRSEDGPRGLLITLPEPL